MAKKADLKLNYRAASLGSGGPKTLDREARTLALVIATETPVDMYDYEEGRIVPEVLLAKGAVMPRSVPLLDTHSRWGVSSVLGSVSKKQVEDDLVIGVARFSSVPAGEEALTKYEEGHLTDFSAGYTVNSVVRVKKGEKAEIGGRTWKGPVNVVTSWTVKEVSCCPIGADARAKARSEENNHQEIDMDLEERLKKLEEHLRSLQGSIEKLAGDMGSIAERSKKEQQIDDVEKEIEQLRQEKIRAGAATVANERKRIAEIDQMCERFDIDNDFRLQLIQDGTAEDKARVLVMERLAARKTDDAGMRISVTRDERDKSRDAAVEGIQIRAGIQADKVKDAQNEFQHLSLFELAKNRMACFNEPTRGMDKMQIFQRALSHSDFDNILADVANKALLEGFEKAEETYTEWVDASGRVNDFKTHIFARASEAPSLVEVNPDGGEYKYGNMGDAKESVTVVDYGIIVPFTRKAMVNDDLGALADIREKLGAASSRKYGDLCYAVLTAAHTMGDGNALWDASNHSNYLAAGYAPSVSRLNAIAAAMGTQKDIKGIQILNIRPQFILAPWALKGTVDNLLVSTTPAVIGSISSPVVNPWSHLKPVYDGRLDAASTTAWYAAARKGMTVKLFTLNGNMTPMLESKAGWATDGMEFKARITAAAKAMDWRGMYKDAGTGGA